MLGELLGERVGSVEAGEHRVVHSGCIVVGVHALVVEPAASDVQTVGGACRRKVVRHTAGVVGGELASASILVHNSHSRFEVVLDEILNASIFRVYQLPFLIVARILISVYAHA